MEITQQLLQKLVCSQCDDVLRRGPVFQRSDGAAVCGPCQEREGAAPASRCRLYEATAPYFLFPCRYKENGCPDTVPFSPAGSEGPKHEEACEYRVYVCPLLGPKHCEWSGRRAAMLQHCRDQHPDRVLHNPSTITPDIRCCLATNFLIPTYHFLFLLHTRVCVTTASLHYAVRLLAEPLRAADYMYSITIWRGEDIVSRTRDVLQQERLILKQHSALHFNINSLLGMLGGWDGATVAVEVRRRDGAMSGPRDGAVSGPKYDVVSGPRDWAGSGPKHEAVSVPRDEAVSGPRDEAVSGPRDEVVTELKDEAVSGPRDEAVSGPRDEAVSGAREKEVSVTRDKAVSGPRDEEVSGMRDGAVSVSRDEAVSGPRDEVVSGTTDGAVSVLSDEAVSGPRDEAVSGPRDEAVSGPRDEAVSGTRDGAVSVSRDEVVSGPRIEVVSGLSDGTVSGPRDGTVSGPRVEVLSVPRDGTVSGPRDEAMFGPRDEEVSGPKDEAVSRPRNEAVSGPSDEAVSESRDGTVSGPRDEVISGPRKVETEQETCGECGALTARLYRDDDRGWLCERCAPDMETCYNEVCDFQDFHEKRTKHSMFWCERCTHCWVCREDVQGATSAQHYPTCREVTQGVPCLIPRGPWKWFLVDSGAGPVLCWSGFTEGGFWLKVYAPVSGRQLPRYRCGVRLECAGHTRTFTPHPVYSEWWDWGVECGDRQFLSGPDVRFWLDITRTG